MSSSLHVYKRDGSKQILNAEKVRSRIEKLAYGLNLNIIQLVNAVASKLSDGITTRELDKFAAQLCYSSNYIADYATLASRLEVSGLHKDTLNTYSKYYKINAKTGESVANINKNLFWHNIDILYHNITDSGIRAPKVCTNIYNIARVNSVAIQKLIDYNRDYYYTYDAITNLRKGKYLMTANVNGVEETVERPQHMHMRIAISLVCGEECALSMFSKENMSLEYFGEMTDKLRYPKATSYPVSYDDEYRLYPAALEEIASIYNCLSKLYYTHASPTIFYIGTPKPQLASCYLISMKEDSVEGMYDTLKSIASISKSAGGIGVHIHNIRPYGSYIEGSGGQSTGIVPMLKVYDQSAGHIDQGGKRPGAVAVYLAPWHADILKFVPLRSKLGEDADRVKRLLTALWIPDLFMKKLGNREKYGDDWYLIDPNACKVDLSNYYGDEFEYIYMDLVEKKKYTDVVSVSELWKAILTQKLETGLPYILYSDHANRKSNQINLGTIKSSNLCTEIIEYSSPTETAVCNLASHCVKKYVKRVPDRRDTFMNTELPEDIRAFWEEYFNFKKFENNVRRCVRNLDRIIDFNYYPDITTKRSNLRNRPIGQGIQSLADLFEILAIPYDSKLAASLNHLIFESMYYASLEESVELAIKYGTYHTYPGSPISKGILQFDMWEPGRFPKTKNWEELRAKVVKHGVRNSLTIAPMPTASTSDILGNSSSFEPSRGVIYKRKSGSSETLIYNPRFIQDMTNEGLWSDSMKNIIVNNGSILRGLDIPEYIKRIYASAWEIDTNVIIDMAADRGRFVDQSQSLNFYITSPTKKNLHQYLTRAWMSGLKTGCYYMYRAPAVGAKKTATMEIEAFGPVCSKGSCEG